MLIAMLLVRIALVLSFARCVIAGSSQPYLYAGTETVVKEYMPEANDPGLLFKHVKAPRVVEFYSPRCRACVAFSSSYTKLAANTKKKYPSIQFFAVSCDKFPELCKEYNLEFYPLIRLFRERDGPLSVGTTADFKFDAQDLRTPDKIARHLKVDISGSGSPDDDEDGSTKAPDNGNSEDENKSTTPPDTIAPTSDDEVEDQYVSHHRDQVENYARKHQGLRKFIHRDETKDGRGNLIEKVKFNETTKGMRQYTPSTQEYLQRKEAILKRIQMEQKRSRDRLERVELSKSNLPYAKVVRKPKLMRKISDEEQLIVDVTHSLIMSLLQVFRKGIEDDQKEVLKEWFDLLSVALPPEWEIHRLIDNVRRNFSESTNGKDTFRKVVDYFRPRRTLNKRCGDQGFKAGGFHWPCGFWKLLHVITIGVAEQRGGNNLVETGMMPAGTAVFSTRSAADTIRNYIDMMFDCRECHEHFVSPYDDCEYKHRCRRLTRDRDAKNPAKWKELSLWLWEVHNDISVQLVEERNVVGGTQATNDKVAVVWPNVDTCALCLNSDGKWNKGEVFRFLERTYWPDSEIDPLSDKLLKFEMDGTSGVMTLWLIALAVVVFVYKVIGKNSQAIRQPLVAARLLATQGVSKKGRSV